MQLSFLWSVCLLHLELDSKIFVSDYVSQDPCIQETVAEAKNTMADIVCQI